MTTPICTLPGCGMEMKPIMNDPFGLHPDIPKICPRGVYDSDAHQMLRHLAEIQYRLNKALGMCSMTRSKYTSLQAQLATKDARIAELDGDNAFLRARLEAKWIPCSERMPDDSAIGNYFLLILEDGRESMDLWKMPGIFAFTDIAPTEDKDGATHWMAFPAHPVEVKEKK